MERKRSTNRSRGAGFACVAAGFLLAVLGLSQPSGADPGDPAPPECEAAFEGSPDDQLTLTSDPAAPGPVQVGDTIELTLSWPTDAWESLDKALICVAIDGVMQPEPITYVEKPADNDGEIVHTITVTADAVGDGLLCVAGRISGTPGPANTSDDTHKSEILCFDVEEEVGGDTGGTTTGGDTTGGDTTGGDTTGGDTTGGATTGGTDTDGTDTEVSVSPTVIQQATTGAAGTTGAQVLGTQITKQLPQTGTSSAPLVALGSALVLTGGVLLLSGSRRRAMLEYQPRHMLR